MQPDERTSTATIHVDLAKIEANARSLTGLLPDVAFVGVSKVTCGSSAVARAMLAGGVAAIGDSRLANLQCLNDGGVAAPLWLLRSPTPALAAETVRLADVSLNSELETIRALGAAAVAAGRAHGVVVMVDLGDLREGVLPQDLPAFLEVAEHIAGVVVEGIGTNLTCYGAIVPTAENLGRLMELGEAAERQLGRHLLISGGNSSTLWRALKGGGIPARIDNLRVGESIILGVDTVTRTPIDGLHLDAFVVTAPVIECRVKPSLPEGESAEDAYGNRPTFTDRGQRRRAICAIGRQDIVPEGLRPVDPRVEVLGASSDHMILDVAAVEPPPAVGERIAFVPNYASVLQAFTSAYVVKDFTPPA
jgi:predicted amino acid racemase